MNSDKWKWKFLQLKYVLSLSLFSKYDWEQQCLRLFDDSCKLEMSDIDQSSENNIQC